MVGVDLQDRLDVLEGILAHGLKHVLHLHGRIGFIGHDARRGVAQPHTGPYILYAVLEHVLDLLEQGFDLLLFILVLLGPQLFCGITSIHALELDVLVLADGRGDDLIYLVVHDEHLEILLLVDLEKG